MAPELFRFAENNGKMLYIVASKQEQVEKAVEIFKERYPKLKFMGCRNGYFVSEQEMDAEAKHITQVNPDFLTCCIFSAISIEKLSNLRDGNDIPILLDAYSSTK